MGVFGDPRCPQCDALVPLGSLWQRAPKDRGGIFLVGKVGIGCPTCETKLRILQAGLVTATMGSFAALCAAFGTLGVIEHAKLGSARQDLNLLLIAPSIVAWMILFRRYGYRFARLRPVENGEKVVFPLSRPILEQPPAGQRGDRKTMDVSAPSHGSVEPPGGAEPERPPWICPECKEENPGRFDRCCICDTERDAKGPLDSPS
jgi:hypothetical protein